jgi:hypothetical protein
LTSGFETGFAADIPGVQAHRVEGALFWGFFLRRVNPGRRPVDYGAL